MKAKKMFLVGSALLLCSFVFRNETLKPVPGSVVNFTADGMLGLKVNGTLTINEAEIDFDESDPARSRFAATIDVSSLTTGNSKRDRHLKSADFLDESVYPKIKFVSKSVKPVENGFLCSGILEIKGVKKEVMFPFTATEHKGALSFISEFNINRLEYNVGEKGGGVGHMIRVRLNIATVKVGSN